MARIDDLLKIDGVLAAGEFAPDGALVDYKSNTNMSRELAASTAQFCATVSMLFNTLAGAYSQLTGMNWTPALGDPIPTLSGVIQEMRIDRHDPVTLVVHLARPRFEFVDRGKTRVDW